MKKRAVSAFRKKPVRYVVIDDSGIKNYSGCLTKKFLGDEMQALGVRERFDAELKKALKAKKKMAKYGKTVADWQRELEGKQKSPKLRLF